jgi:molybdopterin converting factor small subunit
MRIKVVFLGATRAYSSDDTITIELDPPSTVADALSKIIEKQPKINNIAKYLFISVNNTLVPRNFCLSDNDEVSLFFRSGGG